MERAEYVFESHSFFKSVAQESGEWAGLAAAVSPFVAVAGVFDTVSSHHAPFPSIRRTFRIG